MDSTGVQYNTAAIVKLKKLYNNIRKQYELNLFRAFLMIDKSSRTSTRQDSGKARGPSPARTPQPVQQTAPVTQTNN